MVKHPEAAEMFRQSAVFKSSIEAIVRGQSEIYCLVEVCKMMDKQIAAWVDHVMVCPAPQMRTK